MSRLESPVVGSQELLTRLTPGLEVRLGEAESLWEMVGGLMQGIPAVMTLKCRVCDLTPHSSQLWKTISKPQCSTFPAQPRPPSCPGSEEALSLVLTPHTSASILLLREASGKSV